MTYSLMVIDLAHRAALLGSRDSVWSSSVIGGGRVAKGSSKEDSLLGFQYGGGVGEGRGLSDPGSNFVKVAAVES